MSKKRFMITGIEKGCYRIGNVKDIRKDTGLLGSVTLSELTGKSCILDMLNQLNNENEQLRQQIERLNLAIDDLASHTSCDDLRKENEQLRQIIKDIVCATDETYTKNTSMFKVTVVFDGKMYNQIRSCLYE